MSDVGLIIPWRDRGGDPMRAANLKFVVAMWQDIGYPPMIITDGRKGDEQFNRSAAYNLGVKHYPDAEVFIFAESDMIVDYMQVERAIWLARQQDGLVVPFDEYRYLSLKDSALVRGGADHLLYRPERIMRHGVSVGAINVVSRQTMNAVGQFDETFDGSWYDDDAAKIAFEMCTGPTRWVSGSAYHLWHRPGWQGGHLTEADRHATRRNKMRLYRYQKAATPERIRELTAGGM